MEAGGRHRKCCLSPLETDGFRISNVKLGCSAKENTITTTGKDDSSSISNLDGIDLLVGLQSDNTGRLLVGQRVDGDLLFPVLLGKDGVRCKLLLALNHRYINCGDRSVCLPASEALPGVPIPFCDKLGGENVKDFWVDWTNLISDHLLPGLHLQSTEQARCRSCENLDSRIESDEEMPARILSEKTQYRVKKKERRHSRLVRRNYRIQIAVAATDRPRE